MTQTFSTQSAPLAQPTASDRAARRKAMAGLVRVEAARLTRHPGTVLTLLILGLVLYAITDARTARFPVLQDADQLSQLPVALLFGGAALIQSNLAVLRPDRHGTADALDVLVLPTRWRTAAHLLALLPLGVFAALFVACHIAYLSARPGAVGSVNPYELATGPVLVLLFGAVGVLLGRLVRSLVAGPLLMVVLAAIMLVTVVLVPPGTSEPNWFLPFAPASGGDPLYGTASVPVDLMTRPAGRHLVYLLGLLALITTAALWRGGPLRQAPGGKSNRSDTGRRRRGLIVAAAAGLVVTVGAGTAQALPPSPSIVAARISATDRPAAQQHCRRMGNVTYCAFAGFEPWVNDWNEVVSGVLRRVPSAVAGRPLAVRQRVVAPYGSPQNRGGGVVSQAPLDEWRADDRAAGTPNAITVGTWWGDGWSETGLAGRVAYASMTGAGPGVSGELCQSRGVLVGWLAAQATPDTRAGLHTMVEGSGAGVAFTEAGFGSGLYLPERELTMVWSLLDQPADVVGKRVLQHWDELSARATTIEQAAEILGVPAPPAQPSEGEQQCL